MSGSSHRQQTCYWLRPPHIRRDGPFPIPVMPCSTALPTPFGGLGFKRGLVPGQSQADRFNNFKNMVDVSVYDDSISYKLPDHVYSEQSRKW